MLFLFRSCHSFRRRRLVHQEEEQVQGPLGADEWLVEFSRLFTEVTGIDPAVHHEHLNLGSDKLARAMDATLSEDEAQPMFDKAVEHFKEATCHSLIQWGTVFSIRADRQGQAHLKAGKQIEGKLLDGMMKEYDECEKK